MLRISLQRFAQHDSAVYARLYLFSDPREYTAQLPQFIIHFVWRAYSLHDFPPHRVSELLAQTMDKRFHCAQSDAHPVGDLLVSDVGFASSEKGRQRFEEIGLALCSAVAANILECPFQDHACPPGIKNFIWCSFITGAQMMQLLSIKFVR